MHAQRVIYWRCYRSGTIHQHATQAEAQTCINCDDAAANAADARSAARKRLLHESRERKIDIFKDFMLGASYVELGEKYRLSRGRIMAVVAQVRLQVMRPNSVFAFASREALEHASTPSDMRLHADEWVEIAEAHRNPAVSFDNASA